MKKRILIVEDERIVAEDIAQCLEERGYHVVGVAKNSETALALAEEHKPDLALMDMVIQGDLDGVDTALALREKFNLPVIFLTAYSQPKVVDRAKLANPLGYIVKPFEEASLVSTVDVALHKCAVDRQMAESHEWFFTTLKAIGDAVVATDNAGEVAFMNESAERLTGWDFREAEGLPVEKVFAIAHAESKEPLANPARAALESGAVFQSEEPAVLRSRVGVDRDVENSASPIRSAEGKILGAALVFRDVTDKRERERQVMLYQSELERLVGERTRALKRRLEFEALVSSICVDLTQISPEGLEAGIESSLQRVIDCLGFSKAHVVESPDRPMLRRKGSCEADDLRRFYWDFGAWYERDLSDQGYVQTRLNSASGAPQGGALAAIADRRGSSLLGLPLGPTHEPWAFLTFICADPERNFEEDVRILQVLAEVINNVLQRRLSEEERMRLVESLTQAQKLEAIGKLSGGIAHDFNNMLVPIIGYSDVILQDPEHFHKRQEIMEIRKAAESAAALTRQLLAFSRKQILSKRDLNVGQVLTAMENMLQRLLGEDIRLAITIAPKLWAVEADRGQLEQVLMNLCVNARDAMPKGGRITISLENMELKSQSLDRPAGKFVRLTVRDTGCGMPGEVRDRVFEPFFTTKGLDGTGLGLSVVLGIVEQHGGCIRVDSVIGKGTSFQIDLPSAGVEASSASAAAPAAKKLYAQKGCERVLLIEDEPSVLAFVRHALVSAGFQVLTASNMQGAMELFESERGEFDLVFSDAVLPDGNGMDVIEKVLESRPAMKVLLSSGYTDRRALLDRALARKVAFLHKPYSLAELYEKLREVMSDAPLDATLELPLANPEPTLAQ